MNTSPKSVDEYISKADLDIRPVLEKLRQTIRDAAPDAIEKISYKSHFMNMVARALKVG